MDLADLVPGLLVQTTKHELLRISTVWPDAVTATMVLPKPQRTSVGVYLRADIATWRAPSKVRLNEYDDAYRRNV